MIYDPPHGLFGMALCSHRAQMAHNELSQLPPRRASSGSLSVRQLSGPAHSAVRCNQNHSCKRMYAQSARAVMLRHDIVCCACNRGWGVGLRCAAAYFGARYDGYS